MSIKTIGPIVELEQFGFLSTASVQNSKSHWSCHIGGRYEIPQDAQLVLIVLNIFEENMSILNPIPALVRFPKSLSEAQSIREKFIILKEVAI